MASRHAWAILGHPMQARWLQPRKQRERMLVLLAVSFFLLVSGFTASAIWRDREDALQESTKRSAAVLQTMASTWSSTLRDAGNAARSAALLLEDRSMGVGGAGEARLHQQLRRELLDETGASRLLYLDAVGNVLASSAESDIARRSLRIPRQPGIVVSRVAGRELRIGFPEPSVVDGETIMPLWCEVGGAVPGLVRAELRLSQFQQAFGPISTLYNGTTVVVDQESGRFLLRLPLLGTGDARLPANPVVRQLLGSSPGPTGTVEVRSGVDGELRIFNWYRMPESSLVIARGLQKDALLVPVWQRARASVAVALLLSLGLVLGVFLLARHLRRLDEALDNAALFEKRYAAALEASSIGIILMDLQGRWLHANPAMCSMLGYTLEEVLAVPSEMHTPEPLRGRRGQQLARLASGEAGRVIEERPVLHKDGHEVWLQVSASLLQEEPGRPPMILSHVQDISQRRADDMALQALNRDLEDRVRERTRELSVVNADLEAFSYSAAHDLRSPLGRLVSYADILATELADAPERTRRWVDAVQRQAKDMNAIIESLLALARIARAEIVPGRFSMAKKVALLVAELERDPSGLATRALWKVGDLPDATGDRALVRVALVNLLGNALKYSHKVERPCVEVGSFDPGEPGFNGYFVRDNGAGFDMGHAEGLFKPFKRMHTVSEFAGSGIGLAIVHRAITRLGGRVWAEAQVDHGATFYFTLPSAAPDAASA